MIQETPKMGETTEDQELLGRRDAFHVPGILVESYLPVTAGCRLVFLNKDLTRVTPSYEAPLSPDHAIADPFLPAPVSPGTKFWALPLPGTTHGLTHRFEVDIEPVVAEAQEPTPESPESPEPEDEEDDSCRGCYGYGDEDDDEDDCKDCYV